jgi:hypothetical protein
MSPGAGAILYVAARIGCAPSFLQPAGAVQRTPPADSANTPIEDTDKINRHIAMHMRMPEV